MLYWAHSNPPQLLAEHLRQTADIARDLASRAAPNDAHFQDVAEWTGLLHDFGKYQDGFQTMIGGGGGRCPHSIYGASVAYGWKAPHMAFAIAGHHAGMPDGGDGSPFQQGLTAARDVVEKLKPRALEDSEELRCLLHAPAHAMENPGERFDLFTRMLFSSLVDADRLNSGGRTPEQAPLRAAERLATLLQHIGNLTPDSSPTVAEARSEILRDCLAAASYPERLLSLSAPTGGGKTLSAMAFALQRAALEPERYRRIIVVIPYLSIIEQNAQVYADVFGGDAVLEHHSGSFDRLVRMDRDHFAPGDESEAQYAEPERRAATENWDAPMVVTTSVRFFESLFSNRPADLRRVHNIAGSIIILDEVQVLPRPLLAPLLDMIKELTDHWGCTFVLSTATKPAFEKPEEPERNDARWPKGSVREIIAEPESLHKRLRRVTIDWRIHEPADWPEVAAWMGKETQALCVVNMREHARILFETLREERGGPLEGLFHLSTRMCPAHRLDVIAEIRRRLKAGLSCLVVSTQLIEAGVDLDFPAAFRAVGPLDSIIQVAGRADRGGKLTAARGEPAGRLVVFLPKDHRLPPNEYETATGLTLAAALRRSIQPDDLEAMAKFYERYYCDTDLGSKFQTMRRKAEFKTLASEFEMISSRTQDVMVLYGEGQRWIDELRKIGNMTRELRVKLQRFTVGLYPWEFETAKGTVLAEIRAGSNLWEVSSAAYDPMTGLRTSLDPEQLIC